MAKDKQKALAITDHGNLYGALRFYNACKKHNVKPIIGCEFYVAKDTRLRKHSVKNGYNHLTLLARDETGYKNLLKLTSISYLDGLSVRARVDSSVLATHSQGITCLSGCLSGRINELFMRERENEAYAAAAELQDIFGKEHFWLEIQRNGLDIQEKVTGDMVKLSQKTGIPLVATNDIHYLRQEDCDFQDTLLCINTGARKVDANRFRFDTNTLYLTSRAKTAQIFRDLPNAVQQSLAIAEQVDVEIPQGTFIFPKVDREEDPGDGLQRLCLEALPERYGEDAVDLNHFVRQRVDHELKVIRNMGFPEYFLIVREIVQYAKSQHIPVGPGRGSAAGSIVSYLLGITTVDPIEHGLLFERFLNSGRAGLPDIDVDFCKERRQQVIDHLRLTYGDDKVAAIITFGTFGAKAAIRQTAKALDIPIRESDRIAKRIPEGASLSEAISNDTGLAREKSKYPELFATAHQIEGMISYAGTHASGVVVGDRPLYEIVPLARQSTRGKQKEGHIITQWDLTDCERAGLVKFDVLGIETLTIIDATRKLVREHYDRDTPEFEDLGRNSKYVYDLLQKGDTECVFQCFSDGMRRLLRELVPTKFDDVVDAIALYRPGPLNSGIARSYIRRRNGREQVSYVHPSVKKFLKGTYGVMIYQEQIMQMASELAGFTMNEADELRKAVGKKLMTMLESIKDKFLNGCKKQKKISQKKASILWEDIVMFGRYGFNRAHSASYAYLTYYTAWLKAKYPLAFYAANLSQEIRNPEKLRAIIVDAKKHGISITSPDLTKSKWQFTPEPKTNSIRIGLGAIKGVGPSLAPWCGEVLWDKITLDAKTISLGDVLKALPKDALRKNTLESLARAGALGFTGLSSGTLCLNAPAIITQVNLSRHTTAAQSLFAEEDEDTSLSIDTSLEWTREETLKGEKEAFGFYLTDHPLTGQEHTCLRTGAMPVSWWLNRKEPTESARVLGVVSDIEVKVVKQGKNKGKKYARLILEDQFGNMTCVFFVRQFTEYQELLERAAENVTPIIVSGKLETLSDVPQLITSAVRTVQGALEGATGVELIIDPEQHPHPSKILELAEQFPGTDRLYLVMKDYRGLTLRTDLLVEPSRQFFEQVRKLYDQQE